MTLPSLGIDIGKFFSTIPDLASTFWNINELKRRGEAALDETGYGFTGTVLVASYFAYLDEIDPRVRDAVATRSFLEFTRRVGFRDELRENFQLSIMLRRRWGIVERALTAHTQRNYVLSIPALLAQTEGVIADALILKGFVVPIRRKLFAKEPNGNIKRGRDGKPIEIRGATQLLKRSGFQDHEILKGIAQAMTDRIIDERHSIVHGRNTNYGKAKLSNQVLLMLWILSQEMVTFEQADTDPETSSAAS